MNNEGWLRTARPNPKAKLRLFCFPYAGASAILFRDWADRVPKDVEICAVQLPGRENRRREMLYTQVGPLVDSLMAPLATRLDIPFAFFGHSLGALVAFLSARQLRDQRHCLPAHLLVSARSAPQSPKRKEPFHVLPQEMLIQRLRRLGGMPDSILAYQELLEYFIPILRADFQVNETYEYSQEPALACPITAFYG